MGVPKFYRWISERYPCLSQVVKDYQIPEFDNFYLDMNGIIHVCSHPNDDDPTFRISEDKIFTDIFNYIEALFRIIKPRKVMFLAVDGVAPRAKMNQQRGRRFRSAREAQDLIRKAIQSGKVMPSEPRFDSNCITPGTEFMAHLQKHLKYFIHQKLSSDPSWQGVEVILSGQDVPGEGEHKIMEYIRYRKAQPDYDPNTRHCLYGLDADLIMLGLLSHEPHFSLLREEIRFGRKSQKRTTSPSTVTFHLLHLSILREYLDFEFEDLKDKLPFGYDLEKVIDDWVLMGFLIGNDFLPHLPNMHIRQASLTYLYGVYKEVLPTLDGYINNGGHLSMKRFEAYLKAVAKHDYDSYGDLRGDIQWMESRKQQGKEKKSKRKPDKRTHPGVGFDGEDEVSFLSRTKDSFMEQAGDSFIGFLGEDSFAGLDSDVTTEEDSQAMEKLQRDLGIRDLESYFDEEDEERAESFEEEFTKYKASYYQEKLGFAHVDEKVLAEQAKCYVVGIQWVLHYYYLGVPSWSWFYPYHYAPYVSDVHGFADLCINFELGTPFLPFEQLLAVLPPASKALLPRAYQGLMMNEDSLIKEFYPEDFKTDLNGKEHEWEAVVLIPFIDEDQLKDAMKPCLSTLLEEEVLRNTAGACLSCCYDNATPSTIYQSPWPEHFPDIKNCKVKVTEERPPVYQVEQDKLVRGLCEGVKLDVYFPGFPSLKHISHCAHLEKRGVRVFQAASRDENVILTITRDDQEALADMPGLAKQLLGKPMFVGWPHLVEAKVHSLTDGKHYYQLGELKDKKAKLVTTALSEPQVKKFNEESFHALRNYGDSKGIDIGDIRVMLYAQVLRGKRYMVDKKGDRTKVFQHKEWAQHPEPFPYQTSVKDIATFAPNFKDKCMNLTDLFPVGAHCFIIANTLQYGCQAEVLSVIPAQCKVEVKAVHKQEPHLSRIQGNHRLSVKYLSSSVVAGKLRISPLLLSRITGSIQVEMGSPDNTKERNRANIGLFWKFSRKNQEIPGFARKMDTKAWSYSTEAMLILEDFLTKYPVMFNYLVNNASQDRYYESQLFPNPDGPENLSSVKEWMKKLPSQSIDSVDCGSDLLDAPQVDAIEKAVKDMPVKTKKMRMRVKPSALFKPSPHQGNLLPDPRATYQLYDRVVNVSMSNAVPFGLRGTIIGILGDQSEGSNNTMYEILFDEDFLGGLTLRSSPNRAYRLPAACLLNLSFGKRLFDSEQDQRNVTLQKSPMDYAFVASGGGARSQMNHFEKYADDYLSNPRRDSRHVGRGHIAGAGVDGPSPKGRGISPGRGRATAMGTPPKHDRTPSGRPDRQEQLSSIESTIKQMADSSTPPHSSSHTPPHLVSYPASAIKLKTSPTKKQQDQANDGDAAAISERESAQVFKNKKAKKPSSERKPRQGGEHGSKHKEGSKTPGKEDQFSAALNALSKMNLSDMPSPSSKSSPAAVKLLSRSGEQIDGTHAADKIEKSFEAAGQDDTVSESKLDPPVSRSDRELSPSVSAMFEAVKSSNQAGAVKQPVVASHPDTAILKSMLNISSSPADNKPYARGRGKVPSSSPAKPVDPAPRTPALLHTPPHQGGSPLAPLSSPNPPILGSYPHGSRPIHPSTLPSEMPDSVLKLFRPPRGGMAAHAAGRDQPQQRPPLIPRYPMPQRQMPPQNPWPGYGYPGYPPPILPVPPNPDNNVHLLMMKAQLLGLPPVEISTKRTDKGFVGMAVVAGVPHHGAQCSSEEEAAQSAAAMANIKLKSYQTPLPSQQPLLYYPPYQMGSYPPSRPGIRYSPQHFPQGPRQTSRFVPLQAQRKSKPATIKSPDVSMPSTSGNTTDLNTGSAQDVGDIVSSSTDPKQPSNTENIVSRAQPEKEGEGTLEKRGDQELTPTKKSSGQNLEQSDQDLTPTKNSSKQSLQTKDQDLTPTRKSKRRSLEQAYVDLATVKDTRQQNNELNSDTVISDSNPAGVKTGEGVTESHNASIAEDQTVLTSGNVPSANADSNEIIRSVTSGNGQSNRDSVQTPLQQSNSSEQFSEKTSLPPENVTTQQEKPTSNTTSLGDSNSDAPNTSDQLAGGEELSDTKEDVIDRIQKQSQETAGDIQRLLQMIQVANTPIVPPEDALTEAVDETNSGKVAPGNQESVGDAVIQAALMSGSLVGAGHEGKELLEEVYQPSNSAQVDDSEVVVVGEIVGATTLTSKNDFHDLNSSLADLEVNEVEPVEPSAEQTQAVSDGVNKEETEIISVEAQGTKTLPTLVQQTSQKRSKFQLAVSFNQ